MIKTRSKPGRGPSGLGSAGREFYRRVQEEFGISDSGGLELLSQASFAIDRADACRLQVAKEGQTIATKSGMKPHPLIQSETAARSLAVRCIAALGIALEPVKPMGRPSNSTRDAHHDWTRNAD